MSQQEHDILSHLPPGFQIDTDKLWDNLVNLFQTSYQNRDIFGIQKSLDQIKCYMTALKYFFNKNADTKEGCDAKIKELYIKLVNPLFDFITTVPFINFNTQAYAARLFSNLFIRVQSRPQVTDVHLSLEKALSLHKELFFQPHRLLKKSLPQKESVDFLLFLSGVHYFFDTKDADMLLEKYLDKIGCFESVSLMATLTLLRFYPTNHESFEKFIHHLVPLIKNPISDETTCAIFHYLDKATTSNELSQKFDWKPYLRTIFNLISNSFNPSVQILNDEYNLSEIDHFEFSIGVSGGFDKDSIPLYSSSFISTLLVDNDEKAQNSVSEDVLTILGDFVNAFIPMITPQSNKAEGSVEFVSNLIKKFASIVKNNNKKVSQETRSKFVKIVLPFVESALFNSPSKIQDSILKSVPKLAFLSDDLTINGIVPFCLQNLVDAEMSSTSKICFRIIKSLIPCLLNEKHIEENLTMIPQIVDACLERCKSSLIDNYYLGLSLLSDISQYISIPADKEMNSKLSMKQRMAATSMINSLKIVVDCHFTHNKAIVSDDSANQFNNNLNEKSNKIDSKSNLNKRFDCYFAAFDDSYIESIVIPSILKYLKNASHATVLNSFTNRIIEYLTNVKPDLIAKVLTPKLEELFIASNTTKKAFWAHSLASTFSSCSSFESVISHYIDLVNSLLKSEDKEKENEDDDKESEAKLESAHVLIHKLLTKVTRPNIIDWSNTEDGTVKWGANYKPYEVYPKWHLIEQKKINSMVESIFNSLQTHLNKFPSYSLKKQKIICKILSSFFSMFDLRGKFGSIDFNDFQDNETFSNIEKSIFEFINQMIPKLQSYQSKEEILVLLSVAIIHHSKMLTNTMTIVQNITKKKKSNSSRFYCLLGYLYETSLTFYNYSYEIKPRLEIVFNNVYDSMESEFESISHQSFFVLNKLAHQSKKIHEDFVIKEIEVLENQDHNEYQLKAALLFLMQNNMYYIMNNTELISRFFKALVSLKFEKDWKIHNYLNSLFDSIESYRQLIHIEDCKAWRDLNDQILTIPRKIDSRHFYSIIRFIVFQDPAPSIEIVKFLINSLKSSSDANRLLSLHSLSNILCRMKPIAPRSNFASVDEFKANEEGILPYIDKMTIGYHCKPHHYVFYTGSSVYNSETTKYEEIRKFLTEQIFVNDRIFTSLFESFTLLHPKEENPTFNSHIYYLWKGIGQITRMSIVNHTKKMILRLLNPRSISMISPVILTSLCELIAGISRSTKHWKNEERSTAINELLIQACTPLVRLKGNDSTNVSVQVMASTIVGDWDYRRVQWLYEIVKKCLTEIECNKEQMNEVALRSAMNFGNIIYMNANEFFNNEYIKIMKEIVIPLFHDMKKFKLDDISYFANFLVCRLSLSKQYHPDDEKKQENYYGSPSFNTSIELASLPFVEVFDKNKNESPDLVALFLSEIFSGKMRDFSFFLPFFVDRFKDVINIDGKLVNITSGKFLHYGKNILCKAGFLRWENYESSTFEVLFENVIKKQILSLRENLPWSSRLDIVGFLHALTFAHFFIFSKKEFMLLIDDVLPPFLEDSNQEVRKAARELLKMLVCITYSDSKDKWAEKIANLFDLASKDKSKLNKNLLVAVSFSCALLANTTIWFNDCPEWLPGILSSLERVYAKGNCKEEIKAAMTDFFTRHEGREIAEIEEYKYAFTDRYFT